MEKRNNELRTEKNHRCKNPHSENEKKILWLKGAALFFLFQILRILVVIYVRVLQSEMLLLSLNISLIVSKLSFIVTLTISFLSIIRDKGIKNVFILANPNKKSYLCLSHWKNLGVGMSSSGFATMAHGYSVMLKQSSRECPFQFPK